MPIWNRRGHIGGMNDAKAKPTPTEQLVELRAVLAAIQREAANKGAGDLAHLAAKADEIVTGLMPEESGAEQIDVYRVPISKKQFERLPKEERSLVFVGGHILNQISVFMKLVMFSSNKDPADQIEATASGMQTYLVLRSLVGVLAEACVYLENRVALIEKYLPSIDKEGQEAYAELSKSFDDKALLRLIRHNFLYHYPNEKVVDKAFRAAPEDEQWEWYLSQANTNSLYQSCEAVLGYGLMQITGEPDWTRAYEMVLKKAMELADVMPEFLMRLIGTIIVQHLGGNILAPQKGTTIRGAPHVQEFWVPFFARVTEPPGN